MKQLTFFIELIYSCFLPCYNVPNKNLAPQFDTLSSSDTQGQSVGSGERVRRKFLSKGERAPRYRLSPSYFQKFKRMPAPDWAQKSFVLLCPIGEQCLLSSSREFVHDGYCLCTLARFVHKAYASKGNFYFLLS